MNIFRQFWKSRSLRVVNLLALSVIFTCLFLSGDYIKKELSYDQHHLNADRIVRLSLRIDDEPIDGRIYMPIDPVLEQIPEIDKVVKLEKLYTALLSYQDKKHIVNDFYLASDNFLEVFTLPLIHGNAEEALNSNDKILISEQYAQKIFGTPEALGKEISISGRNIYPRTLFVSGVFRSFPETSHFHTDIIMHRSNYLSYVYFYLLLKEGTDIRELERKITMSIQDEFMSEGRSIGALLMPLTDIHLHSQHLREMEQNGNIDYIYLITAANLLLLIIALFNLWLNIRLIFSYSRRYYQLLRLNGASAFTVIKDEAQQAMLLGILSMLAGGLAIYIFRGHLFVALSIYEIVVGCFIFLIIIMTVSLLPVITNISSSLFTNRDKDTRSMLFPFVNIRYMLVTQYAIVIFIIILTIGISKQMAMIQQLQVGGCDPHILVMNEQPKDVKERYDLLKSKLLEYSTIQYVTACFQLPGDAIRDGIYVKKEGDDELKRLPIIVVGEDFIPFFQIPLLAGSIFNPYKITFQEEVERLFAVYDGNTLPDMSEEYMLNKKALSVLGFATPEEAIGKLLKVDDPNLGYINNGVICGVTDDFNYTDVRETSDPLLILQRRFFLHHIMVRFDPRRPQEALTDFLQVWEEINPDYPANYSFMNDRYGKLYHNERNAERLVYIFSLLCLIIANLGLVVFMAFIVKHRRKEIAIRKVNGAGIGDIVLMLNLNFLRWILFAFIIAAPVAGYLLHKWLQSFAYKTPVSWWIYPTAGLIVLLLSLLSVTAQSWRAAKTNPLESI